MHTPAPFTYEWALAYFFIARKKAILNKYNISMHQLGLEETEVKWLTRYFNDQGWIVSTSDHITSEKFALWKLPDQWKPYAPGERRGMLDEELELYLGVAYLVMEKNGRIPVNKFAEYASLEGLWRMLETGDVDMKICSSRAYRFTLDSCYRP